ncbi:MAG: hypothetical protein KA054_01415 [Candidatus Moranbacteria bacterium]|nr:hypothetical protein [Candidatus Moranbacteria bacterium]
MIELRFLCNDVSLYWHEPKGDKPGVLNSEHIYEERTGILVFKKDQDYPAFYLYDETSTKDAATFYLVAIGMNENAFIILRRHVHSSEAVRSFFLDHRPKRPSKIPYTITNQDNIE